MPRWDGQRHATLPGKRNAAGRRNSEDPRAKLR